MDTIQQNGRILYLWDLIHHSLYLVSSFRPGQRGHKMLSCVDLMQNPLLWRQTLIDLTELGSSLRSDTCKWLHKTRETTIPGPVERTEYHVYCNWVAKSSLSSSFFLSCKQQLKPVAMKLSAAQAFSCAVQHCTLLADWEKWQSMRVSTCCFKTP